MELEPATTPFDPTPDNRPKLVPPPPVKLVAVADVSLQTVPGLEKELDAFYVGLLRFDRDPTEGGLVYRAENFRLRFAVVEVPEPREDLRPTGVMVPSLAALVQQLLDRQIEYARQRALTPGLDTVTFTDPAGNLVEAVEVQRIM